MTQFDVELFGTPGSGKTMIITSVYRHLASNGRFRLVASPGVLAQAKLIDSRKPPAITKEHEEELVVDTGDGNKIRLIAHKGEALLSPEMGLDSKNKITHFRAANNKRFVAVLNPFLCDEGIAWKATRAMIATLQSSIGIDFAKAVSLALPALFHLDNMEENAPQLKRLLEKPSAKTIRIKFDHNEPEHNLRFSWDGDETSVRQLRDELRRYTKQAVAATLKYRVAIRDILREVQGGVVILTHIDLEDLMPAIDRSDFEPIFDHMFEDRPNRLVSQQLFAAMIKSDVSADGIVIWDTLEQFPERFFGYIVAFTQAARKAVWKASKFIWAFYIIAGASLLWAAYIGWGAVLPVFAVSGMGWLAIRDATIDGIGWLAIRNAPRRIR